MECRFWPEIITKNQDGTILKMLPVIPSKVHNILKKVEHMCGTKITYPWTSIGWLAHSNFGQQEERN